MLVTTVCFELDAEVEGPPPYWLSVAERIVRGKERAFVKKIVMVSHSLWDCLQQAKREMGKIELFRGAVLIAQREAIVDHPHRKERRKVRVSGKDREALANTG